MQDNILQISYLVKFLKLGIEQVCSLISSDKFTIS